MSDDVFCFREHGTVRRVKGRLDENRQQDSLAELRRHGFRPQGPVLRLIECEDSLEEQPGPSLA